MRISDINRTNTTSSTKKKQSSQAASGFSDLLGGGVDSSTEAQALSGVGALTSLDGLLDIQQVDLAVEARRQQIQHGKHLLEFLDELQIGMLQGNIPISTVQRMVQETKSKHESENEPELAKIIQEIELRAEVELAKLEKNIYS